MQRIATTILGFVALLFVSALASNSARAGEYYYSGGYNGGYSGGNVWYSSSCCYRKIVKHVRKVRYVRTDDGYSNGYYAPRYQSSYYDTPYRSAVYGEPYRGPVYYGRPYRYYGGEYAGGYGGGYRVSYGGYGGYGGGCTVRRVRVADGYGGWVWASSRVCY